MTIKLELTNHLQIPNTSHLLYLFEDRDRYLDNMMAYIKAGIKRNHHLLIVERSSIYEEANKRIKNLFSNDEQKQIHYVDNFTFYGCYEDFHMHHILENFSQILYPFKNKNTTIRTWAHVEWKKQDDISSKLEEFEHFADSSVNELGVMSVCAYAATDLPATLQQSLMRSHEYLMTDGELVRSPLYKAHIK